MKPFKSLSSNYESLELDYPRMSTGGHQGESASDAAAIYPSLSVKPPRSFDFSKFEEWPRWVKRFERYRVISGLSKKEGALQVNPYFTLWVASPKISLQALPLMIAPTKIKLRPPTRTRSGRTSGLNSLQVFIVWPNSVNMDLYEMK